MGSIPKGYKLIATHINIELHQKVKEKLERQKTRKSFTCLMAELLTEWLKKADE